MDYGRLPVTGASVIVGGVLFNETRLIVLAVGLVAFGAVLLRTGWRRRKSVSAR